MVDAALASAIAKALVRSLLEQTGLPSPARQIVQVPIDHLLSRTERSAAKKTIEGIARGVAAELMTFPSEFEENKGSAASAAATLLELLASANITAKRLVELELNPSLVQQVLLAAGAEHLKLAGAERQGHVERAVLRLSQLLVHHAPELPGVQLAFMQAMLRYRRSEA